MSDSISFEFAHADWMNCLVFQLFSAIFLAFSLFTSTALDLGIRQLSFSSFTSSSISCLETAPLFKVSSLLFTCSSLALSIFNSASFLSSASLGKSFLSSTNSSIFSLLYTLIPQSISLMCSSSCSESQNGLGVWSAPVSISSSNSFSLSLQTSGRWSHSQYGVEIEMMFLCTLFLMGFFVGLWLAVGDSSSESSSSDLSDSCSSSSILCIFCCVFSIYSSVEMLSVFSFLPLLISVKNRLFLCCRSDRVMFIMEDTRDWLMLCSFSNSTFSFSLTVVLLQVFTSPLFSSSNSLQFLWMFSTSLSNLQSENSFSKLLFQVSIPSISPFWIFLVAFSMDSSQLLESSSMFLSSISLMNRDSSFLSLLLSCSSLSFSSFFALSLLFAILSLHFHPEQSILAWVSLGILTLPLDCAAVLLCSYLFLSLTNFNVADGAFLDSATIVFTSFLPFFSSSFKITLFCIGFDFCLSYSIFSLSFSLFYSSFEVFFAVLFKTLSFFGAFSAFPGSCSMESPNQFRPGSSLLLKAELVVRLSTASLGSVNLVVCVLADSGLQLL